MTTPSSQAPKMPMALKITARIGMAITPPRKRGTTTRLIGSTAIISMPESWSVARIRPISEDSAVPARPANSSAVTTGPSSRQAQRGDHADGFLGAEARQRQEALQRQHHADEQPAA
jgi:hypothetical protein